MLTLIRYGYRTSIFQRHGILKTLYDSLPEQSKQRILVNKKVVALDLKEESVSVRCEDGFEIEGSIVIGADGSHSAVRERTKELASKHFSESQPFGKNLEFETTYRLLFGNCPRIGSAKPGTVYECHRFGTSTQVFTGEDKMWFFLYEQIDKPTSEQRSYTQKDVDEFAARHADHRISKDIHLRDLYKERNSLGATDLEEGILEKWWWKRIVLVGDAAHKITPNAGLGFNSGVQDLAAIANGIRSLQSKGGSLLDNEAIEALFSQYQSERTAPMKTYGDLSAKTTRMCAWGSRFTMIWDRYIVPTFNLEILMSRLIVVPTMSNSLVLDWLPEPNHRSGTMPWKKFPNPTLFEGTH
jgi:2-polyprenyl-6-methoxyphenol hydroxylase-like FAD-dependent oxidoreductase